MSKTPASGPVRQKPISVRHERDATFHDLADISPSPVFIFQGTRIIYVNQASEQLTGFSKQELLQSNFYDLVSAGRRKFIRDWGMKIQRNEEIPAHTEFTIISKEGAERWVDFRANLIAYEGKPAVLVTAALLMGIKPPITIKTFFIESRRLPMMRRNWRHYFPNSKKLSQK